MHTRIYLSFFDGTHRSEENAADWGFAACMPKMKPMRECRNSRGLIPANPHLAKQLLWREVRGLAEPIDLPGHVAIEPLADLAADSPHLHRIEESSIERDTHVPCRQPREREATACLCESGIGQFRQPAGEQDACRLSG